MPVFEHEDARRILAGLIKLMPESDVIMTFSGKNSLGGTFCFPDMTLKLADCRIGNDGSRIEITAESRLGFTIKMVWLANGEKGRKRVKADFNQPKITSLVVSDSSTAGLINQLFRAEDRVEA